MSYECTISNGWNIIKNKKFFQRFDCCSYFKCTCLRNLNSRTNNTKHCKNFF